MIETLALAELFPEFGSTADLFPRATVLLSVEPFNNVALVCATSVTVCVSPLAREAKPMVCGLGSVCVQTPVPVEEQETKEAPVGRLSTMLADVASGPLFVMVTV